MDNGEESNQPAEATDSGHNAKPVIAGSDFGNIVQPIGQEAYFTVPVLIEVTTYGYQYQAEAIAGEIKRLLEVGLQKEVTVHRMFQRESDLSSYHKGLEVERNDRNAKQERGEVE